jgi:regulation of enolase protein 1 (concanavalin A-like superfamily)
VPGGILLTGRAKASHFRDPGEETAGAERWVAPVVGDFALSALVTADFRNSLDAGVLLGHIDGSTWFTVCPEFQAQADGCIRVASVVTRQGAWDYASGWVVALGRAHLRISRMGRVFALHAPDDGRRWALVRCFAMGHIDERPIRVGLLVQSPTRDGCTVQFEQVRFRADTLRSLRDGS